MIDEFNEQERPISKAQLIDLFCASLALYENQPINKSLLQNIIQKISPLSFRQLTVLFSTTGKFDIS